MPGRRFLVIVAVLMGLMALAASLAPQQGRVPGTPPDGGPAASPTPASGGDDPAASEGTAPPGADAPPPSGGTAPPDTARTAQPLERTVSAEGGPDRVVVTQGDLVLLQVAANEVDSVRLGGLDQIDAVAPESAARFDLLLDEPGRYPIELLDSGRRIGTLVVRPAG